MREGTSGFWTTQKDGKISIGYEDYGVSLFGGGDFEHTYYLDEENSLLKPCPAPSMIFSRRESSSAE